MTSCLNSLARWQCSRWEGGQRDDLGMVSVLLHGNMCCDLSLEPSRRGGSNEGPQHIFCLEMGEIIFELSSIPLLIWSSGRAFMLFSFRHLNNNNTKYTTFMAFYLHCWQRSKYHMNML